MKLVQGKLYLIQDTNGDTQIYTWCGEDCERTGITDDDVRNHWIRCPTILEESCKIIGCIDVEALKITPVVDERVEGEYYIVQCGGNPKVRHIFRCITSHDSRYTGLDNDVNIFESRGGQYDVDDMKTQYTVIRKVELE